MHLVGVHMLMEAAAHQARAGPIPDEHPRQPALNHMACWVACRISGIVGTIHSQWSSTRIILLGVLPRGTDYWDGPGPGRSQWPNVLTPAIDALNSQLQVRAAPPLASAMSTMSDESHTYPTARGYEDEFDALHASSATRIGPACMCPPFCSHMAGGLLMQA